VKIFIVQNELKLQLKTKTEITLHTI